MVALPRAAIYCLAVAAATGRGDTTLGSREDQAVGCATSEEPPTDVRETRRSELEADGHREARVGVPILSRNRHPDSGGINPKGLSVQQITPIDTKRHDADGDVFVSRGSLFVSRNSFEALFRTAEGSIRRVMERLRKRRNGFSSATQTIVKAEEFVGSKFQAIRVSVRRAKAEAIRKAKAIREARAIRGAIEQSEVKGKAFQVTEEVRRKWAELLAHGEKQSLRVP
uniref:Uncharacterized protein n=1 Tax=Zooxanthella nutricula TaxID=1333877 RepID=A0A6U9J4S8_9DINO